MLRKASYAIGACVLMFLTAPTASAQEGDELPLPVAEASAGYAFMRDTTIEENFPAGWYFSTAANLTRWFGVAGEVNGSHKTLDGFVLAPVSVKASLYTFMGGPRFFIKRGRIVPFAQVLAGAAHLRFNATDTSLDADGSDTKFALQPGGGVTVLLTPNASVRGAVDYRRIVFTEDDEFDEDESQVRFIAGVVFGWGAR
jgi:opacity protein-like surface antigen